MKIFVVLIILGLMLALIAFGLVPPVPSVPLTTIRAAPSVHELTAADVETFLDGIVPLQLVRVASALPNREDVAGAIVAVVKDGGYADVKNKERVVASVRDFES